MSNSNSKYSKLLILSILSFFLLIVSGEDLAYGGIWGKLSKKAGKKAGKEVVEKSAKEAASDIAEKAFIKNTSKTATLKNATIKELRSTPIVEKQFKKKTTAEILEDASQTVALKSARVISAKESAHAVAATMEKEALEKGSAILEKRQLINSSKISVERNFRREAEIYLAKHEGKQVGKTVAKGTINEVEDLLGKRASSIWERLCVKETMEADTKLLLKDISSNKVLRKAIQRNPDLLKAYYQLINSSYRTDLGMLRYVNFGAGKYGRMMPKFGSAWGYGDDIVIKNINGINYIYNGSGDFLGTITGYSTRGYVIECSASNRTLLNIFPLKNTTYICGNNLWKTDEFGRVIYAKSVQTGKVPNVVGRDNNIQRDVVVLKNNYSVNGDMLNNGLLHSDDEGGHIIALQNGGTNDLLNFVPQSPTINRNQDAFTTLLQAWYNSERTANKALAKGSRVEREVYLHYADNSSMRPSSFGLTQKVDGKIEILKENKYGGAIILDNVEIPNS